MLATIMAGISGSGKSTWAKYCRPGALVVSADHYFTGEDGVYRFVSTKIGEAHASCVRKFIDLCRAGKPEVLVDNTNTSKEEMNVYMAIAGAYGYTVEIVYMKCDPNEAIRRNTHGTPPDTITKMHKKLEQTMSNLPPWWPKPTVVGE